VINNVETWANIPAIMSHGPEWYAAIGTENSKGTKVFSLVGAVNNTGLVKCPWAPLSGRWSIDLGGGIRGGGEFKAVQTGGPSGGCIPKQFLTCRWTTTASSPWDPFMGPRHDRHGRDQLHGGRGPLLHVLPSTTEFLRQNAPPAEKAPSTCEILTEITKGNGQGRAHPLMEELFGREKTPNPWAPPALSPPSLPGGALGARGKAPPRGQSVKVGRGQNP